MLQKGKDDNQFDITEALKTRKPLRKTTKAKLLVGTRPEGSENGENFLLKNRLKGSKLSSTARGKKYFSLNPRKTLLSTSK